jgi:FkbM family methyltransferase
MTRLAYRVVGALPEPIVRRLVELRHSSPTARRLIDRVARHMRHQVVVIESGAGKGLEMDCRGGKMTYGLGTNEPEVQRLLADMLQPGDVFYDIGANVGFFTLIGARLVGAEGAVYAFEPVPEHAETLRQNIARNRMSNVLVSEQAVSSTGGIGHLELDTDPVGAHLAPMQASANSIQVELVAIDDLVEAGSIQPPRLIKLDIEGEEIEAIEGCDARSNAAFRSLCASCTGPGTPSRKRWTPWVTTFGSSRTPSCTTIRMP